VVDHGDQHRELPKAIHPIIPFSVILIFLFSTFADIFAILCWHPKRGLTLMTEPQGPPREIALEPYREVCAWLRRIEKIPGFKLVPVSPISLPT
jgi:hypothetical protein